MDFFLFLTPGDSERSSLLLVAAGRSAHRPAVPAVRSLHDQPQRPPGEDSADPHISAEHHQQLELPPQQTSSWDFEGTFRKTPSSATSAPVRRQLKAILWGVRRCSYRRQGRERQRLPQGHHQTLSLLKSLSAVASAPNLKDGRCFCIG